MICYRDMTFCPFWQDCSGALGCGRALTPAVREAAEKWWGGKDAPICEYESKPDCYERRK